MLNTALKTPFIADHAETTCTWMGIIIIIIIIIITIIIIIINIIIIITFIILKRNRFAES